eukprot:7474216-Ditylum_brightwellii.AAC.1
MPSGMDVHKQATAWVSTDQDELIIIIPMFPFLAQCDCAFDMLVKDLKSFDPNMRPYIMTILKYHPRCAAHMVLASKVKGPKAMT